MTLFETILVTIALLGQRHLLKWRTTTIPAFRSWIEKQGLIAKAKRFYTKIFYWCHRPVHYCTVLKSFFQIENCSLCFKPPNYYNTSIVLLCYSQIPATFAKVGERSGDVWGFLEQLWRKFGETCVFPLTHQCDPGLIWILNSASCGLNLLMLIVLTPGQRFYPGFPYSSKTNILNGNTIWQQVYLSYQPVEFYINAPSIVVICSLHRHTQSGASIWVTWISLSIY